MLLSVYTVIDTNPDTCYDVIKQSFDSYYAPYVLALRFALPPFIKKQTTLTYNEPKEREI